MFHNVIEVGIGAKRSIVDTDGYNVIVIERFLDRLYNISLGNMESGKPTFTRIEFVLGKLPVAEQIGIGNDLLSEARTAGHQEIWLL